MKNKSLFRSLFLALALVFAGQGICPAADPGINISQYLYEYALQLYQRQNFPDAAHELGKCLMVNPNHCPAKELLRKIYPLEGLRISTPFAAAGKVCPNREITFEAALPGYYGPLNFIYRWDFGDGMVVDAGPKVTHSYAQGGKYLVRVIIDEQRISRCPCDTQELEVYVNSPPVADVGPNMVCCVNQEAFFDGSASSDADGDNLSYHWDFGDGSGAEGMTVVHRYTSVGKYRVTLAVSDGSGFPCDTAYASFIATVSDKPTAVMDIISQ